MKGLMILACAALAGCATHSGPKPQMLKAPPHWNQPSPSETLATDVSWQYLRDAELTRLLDLSLQSNPGLAAAQARVAQAQAMLGGIGASSMPELDLSVGGDRAKVTNLYGGSGKARRLPALVRNEAGGMLAFQYRPDVFGHVAAEQASAAASAEASEAERSNVERLLAKQLLESYLDARFAENQLQLATEALTLLAQKESVVQRRLSAGLATRTDLNRVEKQLRDKRQQQTEWEQILKTEQIRLALLCGQVPGQLTWRSQPLPDVPASPPLSLPAETLVQRPDVSAAWMRLNAAASDSQRARLERYPRVNLSSNLLMADLIGWMAQASASISLWDGGRIAAEVRHADAVFAEAQSQYHEQVLQVFAEVETAMSRQQASWQALAVADKNLRGVEEQRQGIHKLTTHGLQDMQRLLLEDLALLEAQAELNTYRKEALLAWGDLVTALGLMPLKPNAQV
ncbi:hypothetical protein DB032_23385 [Chromobacterium sp. Panama]|uniref:TolC family protein n=1 Tax=Chromobacterium sp. Panama TaxID=2161826 RepID=UPI000D307C32|nr:TolC family protein [Chromobacterium sp. Panama]PTU63377.1 hypothetical protein DB032_23385 [Chromobacterium sp. Panama]